MPVSPDRVVITSGTSEGIELALTALAEAGDEVLVPSPTYPLYTAVLAKIGARGGVLPHRSRDTAGCRTSITSSEPDHARDARARRHRSEQSDRRHLSRRTCAAALIDIAERHNLPLLADEVYGDLAYDGPVPPMASLDPGRADHFVLVAVEGVSRARLARRLDGGRPHRRLDDVLAGDQEAGGRPPVHDRADAVRDRRGAHRRSLAPAALPRRAARARRRSPRAPQRDRRHARASRRRPRSTRCRKCRCRRA